jgi:hypothetical protein
MRKRWVLWTIALVVTLVSAVYQRMTGPTYPVRGHVVLGGQDIAYRLERSHETSADQVVQIRVPDASVTGEMSWRRYPSSEDFQKVPLVRSADLLQATLPKQPAAGKLEYQVRLFRGEERVLARCRARSPGSRTASRRGCVRTSWRCSWGCCGPRARPRGDHGWQHAGLALVSLALLLVGGFVLGPLMQHQAFGQWWTGVPFGWDLTDNKTLIAVAAWIFAAWQLRGGRHARVAVALACLVTLGVFAIPHSVWGSQINWR